MVRPSRSWLGLAFLAGLAIGGVAVGTATGPGRPGAVGPGGAEEVERFEARVAQLQRALDDAERERGAPALAAPPLPPVDPRVAELEAALATAQARLADALRRNEGLGAALRTTLARQAPGNVEAAGDAGEGPTAPIRLAVGGYVPPAEPLDLVETARLLDSDREEDRRRAYGALARAQDADALPLLQRSLRTAEAGALVPALTQRAAALKDRAWSAMQAVGPPDTPIGGDLGTAWAPKSQEMGEVTLDLDYATPVRVEEVRIHETLHPGAVAKICVRDPDGAWEVLWEGVASAGEAPRWFSPPVRATAYTTRAVRLVLDTDRVAGWNEVDAVELVGDGRRQWAEGATASSSYADER